MHPLPGCEELGRPGTASTGQSSFHSGDSWNFDSAAALLFGGSLRVLLIRESLLTLVATSSQAVTRKDGFLLPQLEQSKGAPDAQTDYDRLGMRPPWRVHRS